MKKFAGDIILRIFTRNHNHMRYSFWDTKWDRIFFSCWIIFWPFNPLPHNNLENQNFEEMKKAFGDVFILNFSNTKHDHMLHAYWDMECLHIHIFTPLLLFCSTIHSEKLKFGRNVKKHLEILSFYACVRLIKIICTPDVMYGSWDMKFNRENYFFILVNFLPFYLPHSSKNENIENETNFLRYHHFTQM